jgi:hypothetical protein
MRYNGSKGRLEGHIVFVSEYDTPETHDVLMKQRDFEIVAEYTYLSFFDYARKAEREESLFRLQNTGGYNEIHGVKR